MSEVACIDAFSGDRGRHGLRKKRNSNAAPPDFGMARLVYDGGTENSVVAAHKLASVRIAERNAPLSSFVASQDLGSGGIFQLRDNA